MTAQEKEEIVVQISEEIKKTEKEIIDLKELTRPISPENAINNKSVNENRRQVAENKLKKLHHSLRKSKEPNFGICARCSGDIQIGRLMLLPESNFCIRCAS